ncbi:MAG: hypothetical protein PF489_02560 [Salinivirgaceae bacterium]|jgi:hypothetical protein|nr:hypothetical protein [Salinivirgaceae bacterium]
MLVFIVLEIFVIWHRKVNTRIYISIIFVVLLFEVGKAQEVWNKLFPEKQAQELADLYRTVRQSTDEPVGYMHLLKYVNVLNDFAALNYAELNEDFQTKVMEVIIAPDTLTSLKENRNIENLSKKFLDLNAILPLFVIQRDASRFDKPIDTLQIVLESGKTVSVIVDNNVIKGYLLSYGDDVLLAEQELRNIDDGEFLTIIDDYRAGDLEKLVVTSSSSDVSDQIATVEGKPEVIAPSGEPQVAKTEKTKTETKTETVDHTPQNNVADQHKSNYTETKNSNRTETGAYVETDTYEVVPEQEPVPSAEVAKGIAYRIQIAAAHSQLSENSLKARYSGNRPINHFNEGGWVKYYVAETPSLSEAQSIIGEPEMPADAFIMAYKDGIKAPLYLNIASGGAGIKDLYPFTTNKTVMVVQIAADKRELNISALKRRYSGTEQIYHLKKGDWHRYSIGLLGNFEQANRMRQNSSVDDAFVTAYRNGKRVDYWVTTPQNAPIKNVPIHYVVQIAASHRPLTDGEIEGKYNGNHQIEHFTENDYHKYAIGKFKTFAEANKVKMECGVLGAFVKAYQNDKKINLYQAKKLTDNN